MSEGNALPPELCSKCGQPMAYHMASRSGFVDTCPTIIEAAEDNEPALVSSNQRLSSGDAIACISMALQNPPNTQEWRQLLSDARYVIEKLEDELTEAKRQRNDEQRLRLSAEQRFTSNEQADPDEYRVMNLTMFVRRLARLLRKHEPDSKAATQALDYLERHGLRGSPLRSPDETQPDASNLESRMLAEIERLQAKLHRIAFASDVPRHWQDFAARGLQRESNAHETCVDSQCATRGPYRCNKPSGHIGMHEAASGPDRVVAWKSSAQETLSPSDKQVAEAMIARCDALSERLAWISRADVHLARAQMFTKEQPVMDELASVAKYLRSMPPMSSAQETSDALRTADDPLRCQCNLSNCRVCNPQKASAYPPCPDCGSTDEGHATPCGRPQKAPARPVPACANPVMINAERYRGCVLPSGHDGDCSPTQKATTDQQPECECGTFCHASRGGLILPLGARCRRDAQNG